MNKIFDGISVLIGLGVFFMGLLLLFNNEVLSNLVPQKYKLVISLLWIAYGLFRIYRVVKSSTNSPESEA